LPSPTDAIQLIQSFAAQHLEEILVALCALVLITLLLAWSALGKCKRLSGQISELQASVHLLDSAEQRRALREMRGQATS
jgi:hypothetical protein